jgi:hypothetical protein
MSAPPVSRSAATSSLNPPARSPCAAENLRPQLAHPVSRPPADGGPVYGRQPGRPSPSSRPPRRGATRQCPGTTVLGARTSDLALPWPRGFQVAGEEHAIGTARLEQVQLVLLAPSWRTGAVQLVNLAGRAAVAPSSRPCALALQHRVPRPRHLRAGRKRHHPARRRARVPRPGHRTVVDGPGRQHCHRLAGHRRALRRGRASVRARPRRRPLRRSRSRRPLARRVAGTSGGGHGPIALADATTKYFPMI